MNEINLTEKAIGRDPDAFCELIGLYRERLYRYAYYRLGHREDAEDAVSECILMAWKQLPGLREAKAFPAWIYRILAGCCNRTLRIMIRSREGQEFLRDQEEPAAPAETAGIEILEALDILREDERNIVLLSVVLGLDSGEISRITGLSPGGVRSSLSRSLKKMRTFLEK